MGMGMGMAMGMGMGNPNMKPGDWMCPSCSNHVFARNSACPKCGESKPEGAGAAGMQGGTGMGMGAGGGLKILSMGGPVPKPGDWDCPNCGDLQFAKNLIC